MRKVVLIISIVLMSSFLSTAQKQFSKPEFEKMVDYANCQYVKAFIEKNEIGNKSYYEGYKRMIEPKLLLASLNDTSSIISYSELCKLLEKNDLARRLAEKINDRKSKYNESPNDESLIKSIGTTGWINIDLSQIATKIQNDIITKSLKENSKIAKSDQVSEAEVVKAQTIQTSTHVDELEVNMNRLTQQYDDLKGEMVINEEQKGNSNFQLYVIIALSIMSLAIVLCFIAIYLLYSEISTFGNSLREFIITEVLESKRVNAKFFQNSRANELDNLIREAKSFQKRFGQMNLDNIASQISNEIGQEELIPPREFLKPLNSPPRYLKGKSGKTFRRVDDSSENSYFKLYNEIGDIAYFEFCGDQNEAIERRIFTDDICNITSGRYQNANSVKTIKPGKIKRVDDYWEVIEPCEIQLV